ncbi:hypothetical protein P3X46_008431 [Hevea brasiliensis]|uniref:SMP domain-containing protein n=1 Tax=Hevea brasiliensis TaxID=3981 RepID=A0ABQ9MIK5_HEVBR|nr:late embryogenesis abundant protein 47-like [Hevea brasiliensis]KAJ9180152.1 hypothetical protein P3X46_008431 [Hevea brasiliensis]
MSQQQLQRSQEPLDGHVFSQEDLTEKTIDTTAPSENAVAGQIQKRGGESGAGNQGLSIAVAGTDTPGMRMVRVRESIAGQIVGQIYQRAPIRPMTPPATFQQSDNISGGGITIGEALEATALTAGEKPVEWSDAAAIQAAEVRATGRNSITPGGVAAAAQSAATLNARTPRDEDKTKLADILADATSKLPMDRPATRKDAEGVTGAEMRNNPYLTTHPAGVSASIAAAARLNQQNFSNNLN